MPPTAAIPTAEDPDATPVAWHRTMAQLPDTYRAPSAPAEPVFEPPAEPRPRRPRRLVRGIVAVVALAAVAVAALVWSRGVDDRLSRAQADMSQALASLTTTIDQATDTLRSSDGRVPEHDTTRDTLATTIDDAELLVAETPDPDASRQDRTTQATDITTRADTTTALLLTAVSAVDDAVATWELNQAVTAHDDALTELAEGIEQGRSRLTGSEGGVLDDAVRVALTAAIDAAETARTTEVDPQDADALTTATTALREHIDALSAARKAVADAQTTWQVEQDRIAAEQAAAAAAAQSTGSGSRSGGGSSSTGSGSGGGSTSSSGSTGSSGSASSGSSGSTSESSGGSTWVESGSDTWCDSGDTSGAEGTGGWC